MIFSYGNRVHVLILGFLCLILCLPAIRGEADNRLNEQEGCPVPFMYDPIIIPFPVIRVSINGHEPLPFVVDTGLSTGMIIEADLAEKLDLKINGSAKALSLHNTKFVETSPFHIEILTAISRNISTDFPFAYIGPLANIHQMHGGPRIAGVIGLPFFTQMTVRFDFGAKTLTLFPNPHPPLSIPGAATVRLKLEEEERAFVDVSLAEGVSTRLLVDTGGTLTKVDASVVTKLKLKGIEETIGGLDDKVKVQTFQLPELKIGAISMPDVTICTNPEGHIPSLGLNVLACFRVILDFRNGFMTLEQPPDYASRIMRDGEAGMSLVQKDQNFRVEHVSKGSAAQKAGVKKGDKVLEIDGYEISKFPEPVVDRLLHGFSGTQATLMLERNGVKRKVSFIRQERFPKPTTLRS